MPKLKVRFERDPGKHCRRKHRWQREEAGFSRGQDDVRVGKCSCLVDTELAQALLDEAVPWSPRTHRK